MTYHANSGPIVRPIMAYMPNEKLPLGAALRMAKQMMTDTHHYLLIKSRHHPTTIQGDAKAGQEVYYIRYVNDHGRAEYATSVTTADVVQWIDQHDRMVGLGDWDVQMFPREEQLPTMLGVM